MGCRACPDLVRSAAASSECGMGAWACPPGLSRRLSVADGSPSAGPPLCSAAETPVSGRLLRGAKPASSGPSHACGTLRLCPVPVCSTLLPVSWVPTPATTRVHAHDTGCADIWFAGSISGSRRTQWAGSHSAPNVLKCGLDGTASVSQGECQTASPPLV